MDMDHRKYEANSIFCSLMRLEYAYYFWMGVKAHGEDEEKGFPATMLLPKLYLQEDPKRLEWRFLRFMHRFCDSIRQNKDAS